MVEVKARAKLNLSLSITGRAGNMHLLDTVITPIDIYDDVRLSARDDEKINVVYVGKEGLFDNDTAFKAARLIQERYATGGVDITITKRIPARAGMGGSSADGAAVARGMERLFGYGKTDADILRQIGGDVTAMYADCTVRAKGTGDLIRPFDIKRRLYFAIVLPRDGVDTASCYRTYDEIGGADGDVEAVERALTEGRDFLPTNALEAAAVRLNPRIEEALSLLKEVGLKVGMTGSGSAVFGYEYDEKALTMKADILRKLIYERKKREEFDILTI